MPARLSFAAAAAASSLITASSFGAPPPQERPTIRISDQKTIFAGTSRGSLGAALPFGGPITRGEDLCCRAPQAFEYDIAARHGEPVPGGGTLAPAAFFSPVTMNNNGLVAFYAQVNGAARNQGIFVSDGTTLTPIVMGCGGGLGSGDPGTGCGDPSPIGGTFSGFMGGTFGAPAINDNGDVLFIADVHGGSAPRGLFLYRAASDDIVRIAAPGDASPLGGTLLEVGPGAMNNARTVLFLAVQSGTQASNYYRWEAGVVTTLARVGEPAPQSGTFTLLGRESLGFADGTNMPVGLIPAINELGQIAFFAIASGPVERGIVFQNGATRTWHVRNTDTTPIGGTYLDYFGPLLNDAGQIAFFADVRLAPNMFNSGWFVGSPAGYRKALVFFDPLPGGECFGLAVSRSPINCLDECGNLLVWSVVRRPDLTEFDILVISPASGSISPVAAETDPLEGGGTVGNMNGWQPNNDARQSVLSAATPGAPGGSFSAHMIARGVIAGDFDGDGDIDLNDLARLLGNFGSVDYLEGDMDGDGDVDIADLALFLARYGLDCR